MTDSEQIEIPAELASSTPATKLVYVVLDNEGPLSQRELIDSTGLSYTGVRDALDRLEDHGRLDAQTNLDDVRERLYDST
jgi:DNA-binding MarR family transcriptional regulator